MDRRRTRLQNAVYYKQRWEEIQKKKRGENGGVDSESRAISDAENVSDSNPGVGVGTVDFGNGECSRRKKTGKSEKGVEINCHSKKIQKKLAVGVKGKMKENKKNVGPIGDVNDDESDDDSDVIYLGEAIAPIVSSLKAGSESGSGSGSKVWCDKREEEQEEEEEDFVDDDVMELKSVNEKEKEEKKVDGEGEEDDEEKRSAEGGRKRRKVGVSRKKRQELGKFSRPLPVEEDEDTDSSSDDSDSSYDSEGNKRDCTQTIGGKGKRKVGKFTKRQHTHASKDLDILQILVDSIWEKGDTLKEKLVSHDEKAPAQQKLPLKFRFEDEDPAPPEKPEWQKEVDYLFEGMEMALASLEIGPPDSGVVEKDHTTPTKTETNPAARCLQGDHETIHDDEIGIRCKYCGLVLQEIKHVLPPLIKQSWDRRGAKRFGESKCAIFDNFPLQNSSCQNKYGCKVSVQAEGTAWDLIPGVKESMYPHQREGFEFLWENIAGGIHIDELGKDLSSGGSGCIISHAPGTGKTRLTIIFLQTYMKQYPQCRPVIIAPRSMLLTWEEEFRKWKVDIPFHNLNTAKFSGLENTSALSCLTQVGNGRRGKEFNRMVKLYSWTKDTSILGISYTLFRKLAKEGEKKKVVDHISKILFQIPGLLVLDEGHTPRNDKSKIYKALLRVETPRRIILSGTPFQNNFGELYNTFCMARPKFADSITSRSGGESSKICARKSNVGRVEWASMTSSICKHTDEKLEELKAMIEKFVHVHKGTILQENLPGLKDALVFLRPTNLQKNLLEMIRGKGKSYIDLAYLVSLITVHPSLLPKRSFKEEDFSVQKAKLKNLKLDPNAGVKTKFVVDLIRLSMSIKEKVLVFSQYIEPLTFIMEHLKSQFDWRQGKEVLYMDGGRDVVQRQSSISVFNDPTSDARVLLASIKACSEGINLVGASRVVLLDVVWNPSVDRQAISRAYRLGQKKVVYVYRLISGTMEGEKYTQLVKKDRLSELVFANKDKDTCNPEISPPVLQDMLLEEMVQHRNLSHMFEKILYQPKECGLIETFNLEVL